jgi:uncharacterized membrane protein
MFSDFCLFKDILTKKIIGRGIRRERLYHLEELKIENSYLVKNGSTKLENIVWLWHKRLGHPSFGYMK